MIEIAAMIISVLFLIFVLLFFIFSQASMNLSYEKAASSARDAEKANRKASKSCAVAFGEDSLAAITHNEAAEKFASAANTWEKLYKSTKKWRCVRNAIFLSKIKNNYGV